MATKVSKKIPGNETLNLIKGASKKLPNQSKKEVSKTPKQATDINKIGETKGAQKIAIKVTTIVLGLILF